ncbi:MAG: 3-oxoacyl-ACP synthase [Bacteroidota bacterium]
MQELKAQIIQHCEQSLQTKIESLKKRLSDIAESKNNETKSSAGDKYETGRAMMQMEEDKAASQLQQLQQTLAQLNQLEWQSHHQDVKPGSLVSTNKGDFFIGIGLGKIMIDHQRIFAISIRSPIGQVLQGKKVGDQVQFNQVIYQLLEIN